MRKQLTRKQTWAERSAYHEAGHAVVTCHFGIRVYTIRMGSNPNAETIATCTIPRSEYASGRWPRHTRTAMRHIKNQIMILQAGFLAEAMFCNTMDIKYELSDLAVGGSSDYDEIARLARRYHRKLGLSLGAKSIWKFIKKCYYETAKILTNGVVWHQVEALAKRLKPGKTLLTDEIVKTVSSARETALLYA